MSDHHGHPGGHTHGGQTSSKPRKQEQERASDEITEVAPGVLRAQLPIQLPGLGHVNCYLLEDRDGVAIVDPGLPGAEPYRHLKRRLADAGFPIERVHTVIVTHSHPDHFGAAGRVRADSDAEIVTHTRFRLIFDPAEPPDVDVEDLPDVMARVERTFPWDPPPWGGPGIEMPWRRRMWFRLAHRFPRLARTPTPTVRLDDAETITLAGREWVAVHTPGHTDDHLCLFDPADGVLLSGDHVLPTITPHIGGMSLNVDPLASFFDSLDKVATFDPDVSVVLPAHGHPFSGIAERACAIQEHHRERLDKLRSAAAEIGRPATVAEYSTHLFSPRAQGAMADSETFAHLEHLRRSGEMERHIHEGPHTYVLVD